MLFEKHTKMFVAEDQTTMCSFISEAERVGIDASVWEDDEGHWFAVYRTSNIKDRRLRKRMIGRKAKDHSIIWGIM